MDFEAYLSAAGFGGCTLSESQRTALVAAWKSESAPPAAAMTDLNAVIAKHSYDQASRTRVEAAVNMAASAGGDEASLELAALRAARPTLGVPTPGIHASTEADVLSASICGTVGVGESALRAVYPEQVVAAAESPAYRGMTIHGLVRRILARAGMDVPARIDHSAIKAALALDIKAAGSWGPSTGGLTNILSSALNKSLLAAYMGQTQTWRAFARVGSLADFKQGSAYRLGGDLNLAKVPPGGEIKHGTLSEESLTNSLDTWARMLGLDRRALINDDLSAFQSIPSAMGKAAARSVDRQAFTIFLNNSSFFTSGRGNVSTGAGSALSIAGLSAAVAKFRGLKDSDGEFLNLQPAVLLVGPTLEPTARQVVSDAGLISGSTTPVSSQNPWSNLNLTVAVSPYLEDTTITGNSTAAWYLLTAPGDAAVLTVDFLNGNQSPTIETAESDFGMLGMAWRCFFDFAANLWDYRGGIRSAGS